MADPAPRQVAGLPCHARRHRAGGRRHSRRRCCNRLRPEPHAVGDARLRDLAEVREPAVHRLVQGARRAQPPRRPDAGRAPARRHRHVGRQPRAGRRLSRPAARHSRDHRHAGRHADGEGREHAAARRRGDRRGRDAGGCGARSRVATASGAGLIFIHPYDDPLVIAGQGTVALEMLAAVPDLDTLVVPIGGGGLISGMAIAAKAHEARHPHHRRAGRALSLDVQRRSKAQSLPMRGDTLAEGIAVKAPGRITTDDRAPPGRRHRAGHARSSSSTR